MKEIATSQYDFAVLREGGCVYVDKTDILAKLAQRVDAQYFIARPRRFGKSLMLSTFRYLFEGRRDLFKGLKIEKTKWDWSKTYPVVHLDMSEVKGATPEALEKNLFGAAKAIARRFSLAVGWSDCGNSANAFAKTLDALVEKNGSFVVLIDEYDVPLQGVLGTGKANDVRQIMHDFYVQLKSRLGSIRFLMITGVTKLTKLSLFSGLNNPTDLTLDSKLCAGLLGYTENEIATYFGDRLAALAKKRKTTSEAVLQELLGWYDSYRFCPDSSVRVCNPISIGKALNNEKLISYWVKTASASLLVERMRALNATLADFENVVVSRDELDVCDAIEMPLVPLAYQSGYLTIKGKSRTEKDEYGYPKLVLGIPNHEVRGALKGVFWNNLMQIEEECFSTLVHVAERQIADAVVETRKGVWVLEFKFNRSAASAIRQIRERGYAESYAGRPVTLVGIKFDPKRKNIDIPKFEPL